MVVLVSATAELCAWIGLMVGSNKLHGGKVSPEDLSKWYFLAYMFLFLFLVFTDPLKLLGAVFIPLSV